jgi:hypothetical protein
MKIHILTNPFNICPSNIYENNNNKYNQIVGIVIVVHNKDPDIIIQTIKSVLINSYSYIPQIIIVDDHSSFPIKNWLIWKTIKSIKPIKVITLKERKGYAEAKNIACNQLRKINNNIEIVVFLEGGSIVSNNWLAPIVHTLGNYIRIIIYMYVYIFLYIAILIIIIFI